MRVGREVCLKRILWCSNLLYNAEWKSRKSI